MTIGDGFRYNSYDCNHENNIHAYHNDISLS